MPLRHPAVALAKANRLESLYKHSKRPQSSLRGPDGTTERQTDRPTDQQTKKVSKTCRMVSIHALTMPKQIVLTRHAKQGLCKTFQSVQVLPLQLGADALAPFLLDDSPHVAQAWSAKPVVDLHSLRVQECLYVPRVDLLVVHVVQLIF